MTAAIEEDDEESLITAWNATGQQTRGSALARALGRA